MLPPSFRSPLVVYHRLPNLLFLLSSFVPHPQTSRRCLCPKELVLRESFVNLSAHACKNRDAFTRANFNFFLHTVNNKICVLLVISWAYPRYMSGSLSNSILFLFNQLTLFNSQRSAVCRYDADMHQHKQCYFARSPPRK